MLLLFEFYILSASLCCLHKTYISTSRRLCYSHVMFMLVMFMVVKFSLMMHWEDFYFRFGECVEHDGICLDGNAGEASS